jgi:GR25 family glycosyltransferase involved in LPS biosynthesis
MKIFIVHYTKLTERKAYMINQLDKNNMNDYEFCEQYDREVMTCAEENRFTNNIPKASQSLILKHFSILQKIASLDNDYAMILEDDAILCNDFNNVLDKYLAQLPNDFDMFFIGNGADLHIESHLIRTNQLVYEKGHEPTRWGGLGCTRCTDSYIVSKNAAIKMSNYIDKIGNLKINIPIDWLLNIIARDTNLKVYWAEPTIVTQGSANGTFTPSYTMI